jgi:raffinose/stachyose/melibiose transport system permease protein
VNRSAAPWVRPIVAILASALFFVPLYLVCVNVLKRGDLIAKEPAALPIPPTLHNLKAVLTRSDNLFVVSLTNSVIVTVLSVLVLTVLAALLGHYLARNRSRWARVLTLVLLCGLMIPPQVILMPIADIMRITHLITTLQGLVLFNVGYYVPFGVFVSWRRRR